MRKKIFFVITKSNWGGAQRYVYDMATSLPSEEFERVVVFGAASEHNPLPGALQQHLAQAGIQTIFLSSLARNVSLAGDLRAFFDLYAFFRRERPDIVHLNSSKIITLGSLAARFARVPRIIATVHGWAFNEPRPEWQRKLILASHWIGALLTHANIVVARADAAQAADWPLMQETIVPIHNGIGAFSMLERDEARRILAIQHNELTAHLHAVWIGTISELHPNKGLDALVSAFAQIDASNTACIIIGAGEAEEPLRVRARELKISNRIFFLGFVEDARKYLKALDIFVLPSRKEGLPYALLEAGAATLPSIASRVGGIPEIIDDGKNGLLFERDDANALAKALKQLLASPEERERFGKALKEKVEKEFSLERMVEGTIKLYRS